MVLYIRTEQVFRSQDSWFQHVLQQIHLYTLLLCTVPYLGVNGRLLFNVEIEGFKKKDGKKGQIRSNVGWPAFVSISDQIRLLGLRRDSKAYSYGNISFLDASSLIDRLELLCQSPVLRGRANRGGQDPHWVQCYMSDTIHRSAHCCPHKQLCELNINAPASGSQMVAQYGVTHI
jgi:hypothetical protein